MTEYRCSNGHGFGGPSTPVPTVCPNCEGGKPCGARAFETGHYTDRLGQWSPDGPPQEFKTKTKVKARR